MKCAVMYYSSSGITRKIAEAVQVRFSADLFFVEPAKEYGSFIPAVARVVKEKASGAVPLPKTAPADFSAYDVVFIGFPVWAGTMPEFMQEYVRGCDLAHKLVIPFATARGSGEKSALKTVKELLPESRVAGYFYTSLMKRADVNAWLDRIAEELAKK